MQHRSAAQEFADVMQQSCLGTRVSRLHRQVARRFDQALRPLGLSISQLELLATLVLHAAPVRPSELAEILSAERSTISRNLAAMQERGWVQVTAVSPTGRAMAVTVTEEGARTLASAQTAWADAQTDVADRLGQASPTTLDTWLDTLA